MFFRRLLSHIVISCAVFLLVATYFIWVVDATFLNSNALNASLKNSGVPSAIASALPQRIATNNSEIDTLTQAKITQVITSQYVERKLNESTKAIVTFVRNGEPQPTISLTDFPGQLRAAGVELSEEQSATFDKPVELNSSGALDKVPRYYKNLELAKYFGILLFLVLLGLEWIVTEKSNKLRRLGRVFLYSGLWFLLFWISLVVIPSKVLDKIDKGANTDPVQQVGVSVIDAAQHLLTPQLLGAAVISLIIAISMYALRRGREHLKNIQEVPVARIKSHAMAKLPTRQ